MCRNLNQNQLATLPKDSLWSMPSLSTLCAAAIRFRSLPSPPSRCSVHTLVPIARSSCGSSSLQRTILRTYTCMLYGTGTCASDRRVSAGGCRRTGGRATVDSGGSRAGCARGARRSRRTRRCARRRRCSPARSSPISPTSTSSARVRLPSPTCTYETTTRYTTQYILYCLPASHGS